jgi:hypothetical protein
MLEARCRRRSTAGSIILVALALLAWASPAAARDPSALGVKDCSGRDRLVTSGSRPGATVTPAPRLRPLLDTNGALSGHRVTLPFGRRAITLELASEAFLSRGPAGLLVLGDDDGAASEVTVVDTTRGCVRLRFSDARVVRGATLDPTADELYYHLVDRQSRRDLGILRRSLTGTRGPQRALPPLGHRTGAGRADRTFSTGLHWSPSGKLAVQSCALAGCRTRLLDPATGTVRDYAAPGQGEIVSVGERALTVRRPCPIAPCPLMTIDLGSGDARPSATDIEAAGDSRPTPSAGTIWAGNEVLEFRWRAGATPPGWMQAEMRAAATDVNTSRRSKAPTFIVDEDATDSLGYETSLPCGATSIGCASKVVPEWWRVGLRVHGHWFDWGQLRWCQALPEPRDGCFDAELVTLHELGHIEVLGHYEDAFEPGEAVGPWADSVMHVVTRARPRTGWNAHAFGRCDVAALQRRYDVPNDTSAYSTCVTLATTLSLGASATSVGYRQPVVLSSVLRVDDRDSYGKLGGNRLSDRPVVIQRRAAGGSTWLSLGEMSPTAGSGGYSFTITPQSTADYRAVFARPAGEGLTGASSVVITVRVAACGGPGCPTSVPAGPASSRR